MDAAQQPATFGLIVAGDLDPGLADDSVLRMAEAAYFTAAGEAFWAEAERIARDRAAQHPPASTRRGEGMNPGPAKARTTQPTSGKITRRSRIP